MSSPGNNLLAGFLIFSVLFFAAALLLRRDAAVDSGVDVQQQDASGAAQAEEDLSVDSGVEVQQDGASEVVQAKETPAVDSGCGRAAAECVSGVAQAKEAPVVAFRGGGNGQGSRQFGISTCFWQGARALSHPRELRPRKTCAAFQAAQAVAGGFRTGHARREPAPRAR